jgi:hypothetical protein
MIALSLADWLAISLFAAIIATTAAIMIGSAWRNSRYGGRKTME